MSIQREYLFNDGSLPDFLAHRHENMLKEIDALDSHRLLNSSLDDLVASLVSEYHVQPITLSDTPEIADRGETDIDVTNNPLYIGATRGQRLSVKGTFVSFALPFQGTAEIFRLRPPTHSSLLPTGTVANNELRITIARPDHDVAAMRRQLEDNLSNIREHLAWGAPEISAFNECLPQHARQRLESRKTKLLADQAMLLPFPIRPPPGAHVASPVRRKPLVITKPAVSSGPFQPEPALEIEHYDHILNVISNMALVIERSPSAFARMTEDDLRSHILVQLNGHYEGQATAETFNSLGKTDILIRIDNRNIFIAECKLWIGADSLKRAIDQLLGYAAWRDTRTAVVMFNRNKSTSAVHKQIPKTVQSHPNFKRDRRGSTSPDFVSSWASATTRTANSSSQFSFPRTTLCVSAAHGRFAASTSRTRCHDSTN